MNASQGFSIVADDREARGAVVAALRRHACVRLRLERLPVGDYRVDDALLFERKTLRDLVASIKDGRLFAQGLRLAQAPLRSAIILEGRSQHLADSHMRREAIQGALVTLTLFLGIPLLRSLDPEETARLILFAARQGRAYASGALHEKGSDHAARRASRAAYSRVYRGSDRSGRGASWSGSAPSRPSSPPRRMRWPRSPASAKAPGGHPLGRAGAPRPLRY